MRHVFTLEENIFNLKTVNVQYYYHYYILGVSIFGYLCTRVGYVICGWVPRYQFTFVKICEMIRISYAKYAVSAEILLLQGVFNIIEQNIYYFFLKLYHYLLNIICKFNMTWCKNHGASWAVSKYTFLNCLHCTWVSLQVNSYPDHNISGQVPEYHWQAYCFY